MTSLNIEEPNFDTPFNPPLVDSQSLIHIANSECISKDDCYFVLASITDGSRFREFKQKFGPNLITGYGFVEGKLAGFFVNCGPIGPDEGQKGAHFAQICDSRDIPMVFLQNGSNSKVEDLGQIQGLALKDRAKFTQSHSVARVPKLSINIGGATGDELFTMCGPSFDPDFYFMWPTAPMAKSKDTENKPMLAQYWVSQGSADGVILPEDTRNVVSKWIKLALLNFVKDRSTRGQKSTVVRI